MSTEAQSTTEKKIRTNKDLVPVFHYTSSYIPVSRVERLSEAAFKEINPGAVWKSSYCNRVISSYISNYHQFMVTRILRLAQKHAIESGRTRIRQRDIIFALDDMNKADFDYDSSALLELRSNINTLKMKTVPTVKNPLTSRVKFYVPEEKTGYRVKDDEKHVETSDEGEDLYDSDFLEEDNLHDRVLRLQKRKVNRKKKGTDDKDDDVTESDSSSDSSSESESSEEEEKSKKKSKGKQPSSKKSSEKTTGKRRRSNK
jgi:hypothetical protein